MWRPEEQRRGITKGHGDRASSSSAKRTHSIKLTWPPAPQHAQRPLSPSPLQVEQVHALLYKSLQLTDQQKGLYAANWQLWEQRRKSNDSHTARTLELLRALPTSLDLPQRYLRHVTAVAAGALEGAAAELEAATLDRHERRALHGEARRLGESAAATAMAATAMRELWTMHEADAVMLAETIDLQVQPGALLEPPQLAQSFGWHLLHRSTPIDFMSICRLAANERRRAAITAAIPVASAVACMPYRGDRETQMLT